MSPKKGSPLIKYSLIAIASATVIVLAFNFIPKWLPGLATWIFILVCLFLFGIGLTLFADQMSQPAGKFFGGILLATYLLLINVEGYWQWIGQATGIDAPSFIWKPFINDSPDLSLLWKGWTLWGHWEWWFAIVFSVVIIQPLQVELWRKSDLWKNITGFSDLDSEDRKASSATALFTILSYAADISSALINYPWIGRGIAPGQILPNIVWSILSVVGFEMAMSVALLALMQWRQGAKNSAYKGQDALGFMDKPSSGGGQRSIARQVD